AALIDGVTECVHYPAEQLMPDRYVEDPASAVCEAAGGELLARTEEHDTDLIGVEVVGETLQSSVQSDQLLGLDAGQTPHARDARAHRDDAPDLARSELCASVRRQHLFDCGECLLRGLVQLVTAPAHPE